MNRGGAPWFVVAVALLVAGCFQDGSAQEPQVPDVDGQAAWQWVHDIVYDGDSLRPRHPSHPGHDDTVAWLAAAMSVDGWDVQTLWSTGQEYLALDKPPSVAFFAERCPQDDRAELPELHFANVLATRAGSGQGHIMLGAHWDAKEEAHDGDGPIPAANDGASGVGLLLQLQREIRDADLRFPFDLSFVLFDGEDGFEDCHPLAGSLHMAATYERAIDRFILLDMVGDPDARFPRESHSVQSDPAMVDLVWSLAPQHGLAENFVDPQRSVLDDHIPFIEAGVPSIDIIDYARPGTSFPPYWHTMEDTPDKLDPDMLGRMGRLVLDVLLHLAKGA